MPRSNRQQRRLQIDFHRNDDEAAPLDALNLEADEVILPQTLFQKVTGRIRYLQSNTSGRILEAIVRAQSPVKHEIPKNADLHKPDIFRVTEPAQPGELPKQHFFACIQGSHNAVRFKVNGTH